MIRVYLCKNFVQLRRLYTNLIAEDIGKENTHYILDPSILNNLHATAQEALAKALQKSEKTWTIGIMSASFLNGLEFASVKNVRQVFPLMCQDEAERFYASYMAGIQFVGEILISENLF